MDMGRLRLGRPNDLHPNLPGRSLSFRYSCRSRYWDDVGMVILQRKSLPMEQKQKSPITFLKEPV